MKKSLYIPMVVGGGGRERMKGIATMIAPNGNFGVV
jgi:hypothetical protein